MAIRLEPYRDYSEHEVINLFSLDTTGATLTDWKAGGTGDFDAGVVVAAAAPIGITLRQSLAYDENGESLLRYPVKKDELQAVLPGHAVPILTRGLVLLGVAAFDAAPSVGDKLALGGAGKLAADAAGTLGQVIAKGVATDDATKTKFLCKVSF
jgi:hypothetical protein